ncbi:MAG: alpha-L-glutamate ligase-like protein [Omnitrophica bacterium GWA2_52_8]|nr:MAG: alpha-L-glutamate ligase-like protein [Omnitrophica bacterium GWA2_52_8]
MLSFFRAGLLGMNKRNADYLLPNNPRQFYPLVDDKLKTKKVLESHGLPVPPTYDEILYDYQSRLFREKKYMKEFVVKPSRGAEGRGILVIADRKTDRFQKASGEWISEDDLEYHVTNILAGLYSLGGIDDVAFIEYLVRSHAAFKHVTFRGVPDIRIIVFRGVPVMSMLRLPTRMSDGKANLHQGAVGVGVSMGDGITYGGVWRNRLASKHPDTGQPVAGVIIPFWHTILEYAAKLYDIFPLGYLGVDFVIDTLLGPLILELNARPGLSIQLANRTGLLSRLQAVEKKGPGIGKQPVSDRLAVTREICVPS